MLSSLLYFLCWECRSIIPKLAELGQIGEVEGTSSASTKAEVKSLTKIGSPRCTQTTKTLIVIIEEGLG